MIYSRFDSSLKLRVYPGEPVTLELQFTDDSGSVERTDGRLFEVVLFSGDGEPIAGAAAPASAAVDGTGPYVSATLDGEQTQQLDGVTEPYYVYRETLWNGADTIIRGKVEVVSAPPPSEGEPPPALGTAGRFVHIVGRRGARTVVLQRGARGFTPEERLAFTRDPETGAPWIDAPTVPAMAEWLRGLAGGAAGDAIEAANAAALHAQTQGDYAETQAEALEQALADLPIRFGLYDLAPDPGGALQSAALNTVLGAGRKLVNIAGGDLHVGPREGQPYILDVRGQTGTVDFHGGRIVNTFDPANFASMSQLGFLKDNVDYRVRNLSLSCDHPVTSQGLVIDKTGNSIIVDIPPDLFPVDWVDLDTFVRIDGSSGYWTDWEYNTDELHRSYPHPIAPRPDLGPYVIEIQLPAKTAAVTGVFSYNPLTLMMPNNGFNDGVLLQFDSSMIGLELAGASVLNGTTRRVRVGGLGEDDDGNLSRVTIATTDGRLINASGATPWQSGGNATTQPVPPFVVIGDTLLLNWRKRGPRVLVANGNTRLDLQFTVHRAASALLVGKDNRDVTIDLTIKGDGLLGAAADGILLRDTRGTIRYKRLVAEGLGDNVIGCITTAIGRTVTAWTANSLRATWADLAGVDPRPTKPRPKDKLYYLEPVNGTVCGDNTVVGYDPADTSNVLLAKDHPSYVDPATGSAVPYDPTTWKILNDSANHDAVLEYVDINGSATCCLNLQARRVRGDYIRLRNIVAEGIRLSSPGASWNGQAIGFAGDARFDYVEMDGVGFTLANDRSGAIVIRRRTGLSLPTAVQQPGPPILFNRWIHDGGGYASMQVFGYDVTIVAFTGRNLGLRRAGVFDQRALVDFYIEHGTLRILTLDGYLPTFLEGPGGRVIIEPYLGWGAITDKAMTGGETAIAFDDPTMRVPASRPGWISVTHNNLLLRPGVDFTTAGGALINLSPAVSDRIGAGDRIRIEPRRLAA